jgi:YNFM family putative membrane transporter
LDYLERGRPGYLRATLALFAGAFVTFAVLYVTQPLMPELSRQFGVGPAVSSLSLSMATGALAVAMLWVPGLSDRWGRKRVMQTALLLSAALSVAIAFAPSFALLLVLRAVQGALLAGFPAIAMAYVTEEFDPRSQGRAMGLYVSGTTLGGMVGRIVTGALTDLWSWRVAIAVIGGISLALALWFMFALPRPRHFSPRPLPARELLHRLGQAARHPAAAGLYALAFVLMGGFVSMYNYISYLLTEPPYGLSQTLAGLIYLVYLAGTLSSAWMGRVADRIGRSRALRISIAVAMVGLIITLLPPVPAKVAGLVWFTFGFFGAHATASSWVPRIVGPYKAQASSLYLLLYYAGSSIVGTVGGWCWSGGGWGAVVALVMVLYAAGYAFETWVTRALSKQRMARAS